MNRLKMVRLIKGKTQVKLMRDCGVCFSTISRIENGWIKPTDEQKEKFANALDVDKEWLFSGSKDDNNI